jgi:hypothetical protein
MAAQESGYATDASLPDTSLIDRRASWYDGKVLRMSSSFMTTILSS